MPISRIISWRTAVIGLIFFSALIISNTFVYLDTKKSWRNARYNAGIVNAKVEILDSLREKHRLESCSEIAAVTQETEIFSVKASSLYSYVNQLGQAGLCARY